MHERVIRTDIIGGHLLLVVGLLVCSALMPEYFFSDGGVSNFGAHVLTAVPYTVALLGCGYFMWRAANKALGSSAIAAEWRRGVRIYAELLVLMLASTYPYQLSPLFDAIHRFIGTVLMLWMVFFGGWLVSHHKSGCAWIALGGIVAGTFAAYLSVAGIVASLFAAQTVAVISFGLLLFVTAPLGNSMHEHTN
jgi:hypothetical protein